MKTNKLSRWTFVLGLLILAVAVSACGATTPTANTVVENEAAVLPVEENDVQINDTAAEADAAADADVAVATATAEHPILSTLSADADPNLTDVEISGLYYMREEEKLAHDVYVYLYEMWGAQVFNNIASSETSHANSVLYLIDFYGLEDPAANSAVGEFVDPDLQALYDQLTAQGSESLQAALLVGAAIEEIDILDIVDYINQTDHADIIQVYQNLISGSENHLAAFVKNIENQTGTIYEPQYLDADTYQSIIGSGVQTNGNSNGQGGRP